MSRIVSPEASMGFIHEPRIECQIPASSRVRPAIFRRWAMVRRRQPAKLRMIHHFFLAMPSPVTT